MNYAEDEQPNEAGHGRPKRILPFVKNTSRGRGQVKVHRNNSYTERGHVRGRGRGYKPSRGRSFAPGVSFSGRSQSPNLDHHSLPPNSQIANPLERTGSKSIDHTVAFKNVPTVDMSYMPQSRHKKFHPKMQNQSQLYRPAQDTINTNTLGRRAKSYTNVASGIPQSSERSPVAGNVASSSKSPLEAVSSATVKTEDTEEPLPTPPNTRATSGTKFITYDKYPKCRFGCGTPADEVRNNRRSVKGHEVLFLRKQGLIIEEVFIRDDGIAIDWSIPPETKLNHSLPLAPPETLQTAANLVTSTNQLAPTALLETKSNPLSSSKALPSYFDAVTTTAYTPPVQHWPPSASTEITYREVAIPSRHLPRCGDTRRLEIWVVEQMRLLEAELGPVLVPPPELIGIGEYVSGQRPSGDIVPCVRILYKRPTCSARASKDTSYTRAHESETRAAIPESHAISSIQTTSDSITSTHIGDIALPPIAHLTRISSPTRYPDDHAIVKFETDQLALDPASPIAVPNIEPSDARPLQAGSLLSTLHSQNSTSGSPNETVLGKRRAILDDELHHAEPVGVQSNDGLDEIRRLRRDLDASKLEVERKHRELERRILELSGKRLKTGASETETVPTDALTSKANDPTRLVDESKSKLLVLRRGKHDKTRRLLSPSQLTLLHISWLGMMQLVNQNTRKITATGFEETAPDNISVDDACLLSDSSAVLALTGGECQLGIVTLGEESLKYHSLSDRPHEAKGICAVAAVNRSTVVTLGHDHRYVYWQLEQDCCSTRPLPIPKLHQCTALAYEPMANILLTAGSDTSKHSKLGVYSLLDSHRIPTIVDLSNHVHHIHTDVDHPSLLVLELARLDDQFQVHDMRLPLYQSVQKFGYQNVAHERGEFRLRGSVKDHLFARGDVGIVRVWDRRQLSSYQTIPVIPHQKVVEITLSGTSLNCATESHHIISYPIY